jgi:hypothetical protein
MADQPEALRLAQELDAYHTMACHKQAAAELRRLHAENERLTNLCYDYTGQITALRAAEQMRTRIDAMKERSKSQCAQGQKTSQHCAVAEQARQEEREACATPWPKAQTKPLWLGNT